MSDDLIPPGYGRLVGRVISAVTVKEGPVPLAGARVSFWPSVARVTRDGDPTPLVVGSPIECTLDEEGFLLGPDGGRGVLLVATDADTRPAGWHWLVRVSAPSVTSYQWRVLVPEGVTTDMVAATADPAVSGLPLLEWRGILTEVWDAHADVMSAVGVVDHDRQWAMAARAGAEQAAGRAEAAAGLAEAAADAASGSASAAHDSQAQATTAKQAAADSADAAGVAADTATQEASAAASSATAAATSATNAATSATAAASSATAAATSATNAATSATAAEDARAGAETAAADVAAHGQIRYDTVSGRYSNVSIQAFFAARSTLTPYGVQIPKGLATECEKTGANAGISNPVPSTLAVPGSDPYIGHSPFFYIEVNGGVESDGTPFVTAIQGDKHFRRDGSNGDVWVMAPILFWDFVDEGDDVHLRVTDSPLAGFEPQPKAFLPDGRRRPFMLYAKYPLSIKDGVARSVSGVAAQTRTVSHNSLITQCKNSTTGYSGKSYADDWYLKTMFLLKYATKNSQSVFAQATLHSQQHAPALAETGVRRVVVTTAQAAAFPVGSAVMVGTNSPASTNRTVAQLYNVVDSAAITSKTDLDGGSTALNLDLPADIDTATTMLISTAPAHCGACDEVLGDGSPTNRLSGREPAVLQGIEFGHGFYETLGDIILSNVGDGWTPMMLADSKLAATSVTAAYTDPGVRIESTDNAWKYPLYPAVAGNGLLYGAGGYGGGSSSGMADVTYINPDSTIGTRQWLGLGSLDVGGFAGLWLVLGNYALSNASWSIGSRLSVVGRGGEAT